MEIPFDFSTVFPDRVQRLDKAMLVRLHPRKCWAVQKAIDHLGTKSAQAQSLRRVVTGYERILDHDDEQAVYLMWQADRAGVSSTLLGLLKVGAKRLYLLDEEARNYEESPLCVLDFYIHESVQRQGKGKEMFEAMLRTEGVRPHQLAFDRPNEKLLAFLEKHYQLIAPVWQHTKFVVYPRFFEDKHSVERREAWKDAQPKEDRCGTRSTSHTSRASSIGGSPFGGSPVMGRSPRFGRDSAAAIIHGEAQLHPRAVFAPNTPQGRKITRDFQHTSLW